MIRLLHTELRKLTTTWLLLGYLAVAVLLGAIVLLPIVFAQTGQMPQGFSLDTAQAQKQLLVQASTGILLGALLGTVSAAREFGHGTAVRTFLIAPHRAPAMGAKLALTVTAGALIGLVLSGVSVVTVAIALPLAGYEFQLGASAVGQQVGVAVLAGVVGAALGTGIGMITRRTGPAVAGIVVVLFIVEPLLGNTISSVAPWLPTSLLSGLAGTMTTGGAQPPSTTAAVLALLAYGAVPMAVALADVTRRDVS